MARRVNTRFVVLLGGALFLGIALVVAVFVYQRILDRDPVRLQARAEQALKAGDKNEALRLYLRACTEAAKAHRAGTDELLTKTGDLAMEMSASAPDAAAGELLYNQAMGCWGTALTQNARYLPAHEKLIEELYKKSMFYRQAANFSQLEDNAKRIVAVDPNYADGYTYLAAAKLYLAMLGTGKQQLDPAVLPEVDTLLKTAVEKDPNSSKPIVLQSQCQDFQAGLATLAGLPEEAHTHADEAVKILKDFLAKHPNDTDATEVLANLYLARRQNDDAVKVLADALAANPGDGRLGDILSRIYAATNRSDEAEAILKKLATLNPNDPESYSRLAHYYQEKQKTPEAIEAFKQILAHPGQGGGIIVVQNRYRESSAIFNISWLYMDAAERAKGGVTSTEGTEDMAQSDMYAGKLRASATADRNMLELLDGRTQLIKNNLDEAIKYLQRADAWYDPHTTAPEWRHTKNLLAVAYNRKREWGLELKYLEQFLKVYPHQPWMLLRKGRALAQVAKYSESLATIDELIRPRAQSPIPADMVLDAKKVAATDYKGMGQMDQYQKLMEEIARDSGGPDAELSLATNFMTTGDLAKAKDVVNKILATDPVNEKALSLAVMICLRQGADHKDEANALLKTALEKYPKNPQFQFLRARIETPETDPIQLQIEYSKFIEDDYARNIFLAQVYLSKNDRSSSLDAFAAAAAALEKNGADEAHDQLSRLSDQAFSLALSTASEARRDSAAADEAAANARTPADKQAALAQKAKAEELLKKCQEQAQLYAQKADRLNLDGVNGKIFQGRLLFSQLATRDQGLNLLEQATASQPDSSNAHTVLGGAYYELNRLDEALTEFQTAITQKPDNMVALIGAIDLLIRKAEKNDVISYERAREYLRQANQFSRNDPQLKRFNDIVGNVKDAIAAREATHLKNPDDEENTRRLAFLYVRLANEGTDRAGNITKAIDLLKPQFDKHKDNVRLGDTIARLYRDLQKFEEGRSIYESMLLVDDPLVHYDTLIAYGDYDATIGMYKDALSLYSDAVAHEPPGREGALARKGDLLFDLEDMNGAEAAYQQLYDKKHDARVQRRLVEALINMQKFDLAQAQLDDLFKSHPNDLDGRILVAYSLIKQSKYAQAIDAFNVILKEHPDNYDAMHYRALAQFASQGDLKQATDDLLTIRSKADSLVQQGRTALVVNSRLLLARVYRLERKYAEAADEYDEVIKNLSPNSPAIRAEYARFLLVLADVFYRIQPENTDEFAESIRVVKPIDRMAALIDDSRKKLPGQPMWFMLEGELLSLNPRYVTQAQQCFEQAFRITQSPEAATLLLNSLLTTKDYQKVIDLASALIANTPKNQTAYGDYYVKRAVAYAYAGKTQESLADFRTAMGLAGRDLNLYLNVVRQATPALKDAMTSELQSRLAAQPSDYFATVALAEILMGKNQGAEATKLLSPLPAQVKVQEDRDIVLRTMAMSKYQTKDFAGASKDYRELLKIKSDDIKGYQEANSDDLQALNNFAFMLADNLNRPQEALALAEKAVKILKTGTIDVAFVNNGNIYDTYGWTLFLTGDTEGAIFQLKQAVQIEQIPIGYLHLAKALAKNGQKLEAQKALQTGIRLAKERNDPDLKTLEAALQELK